jgi:hypothetical protein
MDVITCLDDKGDKLYEGTLINGNGTVNIHSPSVELIRTDKYINC